MIRPPKKGVFIPFYIINRVVLKELNLIGRCDNSAFWYRRHINIHPPEGHHWTTLQFCRSTSKSKSWPRPRHDYLKPLHYPPDSPEGYLFFFFTANTIKQKDLIAGHIGFNAFQSAVSEEKWKLPFPLLCFLSLSPSTSDSNVSIRPSLLPPSLPSRTLSLLSSVPSLFQSKDAHLSVCLRRSLRRRYGVSKYANEVAAYGSFLI